MKRPDVPWVVCWSAEMLFDVRVCPWADNRAALWQPDLPGQGKAIFEDLHVVRARRAVWEWLCPICAEPTEEGHRWWFGKGKADLIREDGTSWAWATANAPTCRRCAETAEDACPHLVSGGWHPMPFPMPDAIVASRITQAKGITLLQGQSVVGPLYFTWRTLPKGVIHAG
ncbi:hypothetical protein KM031_10165 [Gemmobacter fulvus]|uniref:Uncharacterized protein n=1 Tax=Gemmobacter fulvus TaxID=2840474 RepID=A0A975P3V8_9RHOB|nr:hypothetical protein [Gemmobacter fulvus]MBT9246655.1 hypothetical protein [Gemmobacter fulvus]QWK89235.1 hypothetical protein KM031_10165 [Gemmobacter fulvus]